MSNIDFYLRTAAASMFTTAAIAGPSNNIVGPICGGIAVFAALDALRGLADDVINCRPQRPEEGKKPSLDNNVGINL